MKVSVYINLYFEKTRVTKQYQIINKSPCRWGFSFLNIILNSNQNTITMKYIVLLSAIILTSCTTYVPFTESLKNQIEKDGIDLTKLQYYSDKNISLKRSSTKTNKDVEKGTVSLSSTVIRERIYFGKNEYLSGKMLAGVCKGYKPNLMFIYFENGDIDETRITFKLDKKGEYYFNEPLGNIRYSGSLYEIESGNGAKLMVSKKETQKYIDNRRKVKGLYVK